ncbi:MAG TPA: ParA family protein [Gammaproteobacteria bacterium]|nr:ParA family protein [Gammaproteobacteria bacterium]
MRILGVYNSKGGVGKTATAVNFAYLAARDGRRTLVWDPVSCPRAGSPFCVPGWRAPQGSGPKAGSMPVKVR